MRLNLGPRGWGLGVGETWVQGVQSDAVGVPFLVLGNVGATCPPLQNEVCLYDNAL